MVTHPTLQNASRRLRYLINRFVEDQLNTSAAALTFALAGQVMPRQKPGAALLQDNLDQESSLLATPLAELFDTEHTPSA